MRTPEETSLFERDQHLPELSGLFDVSKIAIAAKLPSSALALDYVRYKPQTNCLVRYSIENNGTNDYLYAKTFALNSSIKLDNIALKTPTDCIPPARMDKQSLLYFFPQDAKLRSLWKLSSAEGVSWRESMNMENSNPMNYSILAYKPERRCVLHIHADKNSVVKLYTEDDWAHAYSNAHRALRLKNINATSLVAKSRRHHALRFNYINGATLSENLLNNINLAAFSEAGKLLAQLHSSEAAFEYSLNRKHETETMHNNQQLLSWLIPEAKPLLDKLTNKIVHWLQNEPIHPVNAHGDYYDKQIILTDENLTLLDFDQACIADYRYDIANFIAHLRNRNLPQAKIAEMTFISAYRATTSKNKQALKDLNIYIAYCLLKLAPLPFRSGEAQWATQTHAIINSANDCLDQKG